MGFASSAFARPTPARCDAMFKSEPLIDGKGEVREIQVLDLKQFRHAGDALPVSLRKKVGVRGPHSSGTTDS